MSQNDTSKLNIKPTDLDDIYAFDEDVDFNFNHPPTDDVITLDEEVNDLDGASAGWHMDCVCPKCAENISIDYDLAPANSFVAICSSCSKKAYIVRESCACRSKRKAQGIACANCGKQLDKHAHCSSCGKLFPDYFVVIDPVVARQQNRSKSFSKIWSAIKNLNVSFHPSFGGRASDSTLGQYAPSRMARTSVGTLHSAIPTIAVRAVLLIVVIALIVVGKFAYESYKSRQVYAENYFKVLYCIKTGVDANLKTCNATKAEWEAAISTGLRFSPRISNIDEVKSAKIHNEIDKYLQKINEPPKKLLLANGNLLEIHKIYLNSEELVKAKPVSLQDLSNSIGEITKNMDLASQKLKSTLPDSLKAELANAKLKYRGLKDF